MDSYDNKNRKIIEKLKKNIPYLKQQFNIKKIGLFGSVTKSTFNNESDIDLYIEFEKPIGYKFIQLSDYLEEIFERNVDIITPIGLKSIRIDSIKKDISESIIYV